MSEQERLAEEARRSGAEPEKPRDEGDPPDDPPEGGPWAKLSTGRDPEE